MASVKNCECGRSHDYQDNKYGKGKRVVVPYQDKSTKNDRWRCTVCGKDFSNNSAPEQINPRS